MPTIPHLIKSVLISLLITNQNKSMKKNNCIDGKAIPFRRWKTFLIMKLLCVFILGFMIQTYAVVSYAQTKGLNLQFQNNSLKEVLQILEDQTDFSFIYKDELIDSETRITGNFKETSITEVLQHVLQKEGLTYTIKGKAIVILPNDQEVNVVQQNLTVSGKATDSSGTPLPGVTVIMKGTTTGTVTDVQGNYRLTSVPGNAILVFSFVGMKTRETEVAGKAVVNTVLVEESIGIDEVVAVGYGVQKKVNLTGSVASVSGEELVKRPVTNVASMLQGRMPGVQIVQDSGEPGNEGISIRLRGFGTFSSAGSDPLVLIDGVQGNLNDLNPNNIESISVLKDAASAAIYGARAANGVILVTTKTGQEGKLTVEYSGNYGIHTPTKLFDLITNSAEYMELFNEARVNSGLNSGLYTQEQIDQYRNATDRNLYPNTDWLDLIFKKNAPTQTHDLSFSGGTKATRFNASIGYVSQKGTMKDFDYEKYNARLNISSQVNEKIRFGANIGLKSGKRVGPVFGAEDMFLSAMSQAPTYSPELADGSGRYTYKAYSHEYNNKNPVAVLEMDIDRNTEDYAVNSQGWVEVELLKGLTWYTKGAVNATFLKYKDFKPPLYLYDFRTNEMATTLDLGDVITVEDQQNVYMNLYSYLNYSHTFAEKHDITAQLGYNTEKNTWQYLQGKRKTSPTSNLTEINAGSPAVHYAYGSKNEWAIMSFFGRFNYNYMDRYLVEANMRYDGTSRLISNLRWGIFPSFSVGWRVSEENFMKNLDMAWLDNLKIRASYGELGNQNIGIYPYQALLDFTGNYSFDDQSLTTGVAQQNLSNSNIKWETTTIGDIGIDVSVLQGLELTADWYKKRTSDILRIAQVTGAVGLGAPYINDGIMENTGIELGIVYKKNVNSGAFNRLSYQIGANLEHYENKLVRFGEREIDGYRLREEGKEYNTYYMLEWTGIFQTPEEVASSPKQYNDDTMPGDLKFKDQNKDSKINDEDRVSMSGNYPGLNYSFNMSASWKGFDVSMMFQGVENVKYFVGEWGTIPFIQGAPPTTNWRERWTEDNPSTTMPRIYWGWGAPNKVRRASSYYLQDASYLRLKSLIVGYTLPLMMVKRLGLDNIRFYFAGDNLFTITDYPGLDPERGGSGNYVHYPQNKVFSLGLNVRF